MDKKLLIRTLTGIVFILATLFSVYFGPYSLAIFLLIIVGLGLNEYNGLLKKMKHAYIKSSVYFGSVIFLLLILIKNDLVNERFIWLVLIVLLFLINVILLRRRHKPLVRLSSSVFGILYLVIPFYCLYSIAYFDGETFLLVYDGFFAIAFFTLMWSNDTGAYLVGKSIGKTKLIPKVSPKKTVEGTVGGFIFTVVAALLIYYYSNTFHWIDWLSIGFLISVFGTLGDLLESLFKRSAGVKDSSNLLPGHGGILDRFDSALIAAPVVFAYLKITAL